MYSNYFSKLLVKPTKGQLLTILLIKLHPCCLDRLALIIIECIDDLILDDDQIMQDLRSMFINHHQSWLTWTIHDLHSASSSNLWLRTIKGLLELFSYRTFILKKYSCKKSILWRWWSEKHKKKCLPQTYNKVGKWRKHPGLNESAPPSSFIWCPRFVYRKIRMAWVVNGSKGNNVWPCIIGSYTRLKVLKGHNLLRTFFHKTSSFYYIHSKIK